MIRIFMILMVLWSAQSGAELRLEVGRFSSGDVDGWRQKQFAGQTDYGLKAVDKGFVLHATSLQSASAFYRKITVDLQKTPVLHWRWRKLGVLKPENENNKSGDDYVARIYVIKDGGLFFWKTRAINYVWSYRHRKGDSWNNPFAGAKAKMLSVRAAADGEQQWFEESRNVKQDFSHLMGLDVDSIDGVAIMTDSDNTGGQAQAEYGDIWFSDE